MLCPTFYGRVVPEADIVGSVHTVRAWPQPMLSPTKRRVLSDHRHKRWRERRDGSNDAEALAASLVRPSRRLKIGRL
jgi:hypothetical protein